MASPDDPPTRQVTVTCHTDDCANAGIGLAMTVPDTPDPYVVCGVCGVQITDVTDAPAAPK